MKRPPPANLVAQPDRNRQQGDEYQQNNRQTSQQETEVLLVSGLAALCSRSLANRFGDLLQYRCSAGLDRFDAYAIFIITIRATGFTPPPPPVDDYASDVRKALGLKNY